MNGMIFCSFLKRNSSQKNAPCVFVCCFFGRVLLGLFRNRNNQDRRYLCTLGRYSVFGITEYHSVHSAPDGRLDRLEGMRFTQNRQNTRSFGKFLAGNPTRSPAPVAADFRLKKLDWK